jgi:hypothetical protein
MSIEENVKTVKYFFTAMGRGDRRDGGGGVRRSACVGCGCLCRRSIGEKRS